MTSDPPSVERATHMLNQGHKANAVQQYRLAIEAWQRAIQDYQTLITNGFLDLRTIADLRTIVGRTRLNMGNAFISLGNLNEALVCYRASLTDFNILINQGHEDLLADAGMAQINMGSALYMDGKLEDALICYSAAIAHFQNSNNQDHEQLQTNVAYSQRMMGSAFFSLEKLEESLVCYRAALAGYRTLIDLGQERWRPKVAEIQWKMGAALLSLEDLEEALVCFRGAQAKYQNLIDQGHENLRKDAAIVEMYMGTALYLGGKLDEALVCHRAALACCQTLIAQGDGSLRDATAGIQMGMGNALRSRGNLDEALDCYYAALADHQTLLDQGFEVSTVAIADILVNMGIALCSQGIVDEAMRRFRTALALYQSRISDGKEHLRTNAAEARMAMGNALYLQGNLDEALVYYNATLTDHQTLIDQGREHLRAKAAVTQMSIGNALRSRGNLDEALVCYRTALADYQALIDYGRKHLLANAAMTQMNMGNALFSSGRFDEALVCHRAALDNYKTLIDQGHEHLRSDAAMTQMNMGNVLYSSGRLDKALVSHSAALGNYETLLKQGYVHLLADVANTQMNIGNVLSSSSKFDEALVFYRTALANYLTLIDQGHEHLRAVAAGTQMNMADILNSSGNLEETLACYRAALVTYRELVQSAQRQYMPELFAAHGNLVSTMLKALTQQVVERDKMKAVHQCLVDMQLVQNQLNAMVADLHEFADPKIDYVRLNTLLTVLQAVAAWADARDNSPTVDARIGIDRSALDVLAVWLQRMRSLLSEGSPAFVVKHFENSIAPLQRQVLDWLREWGFAEHVASWHLHTQGLRAQRAAVLQQMESDPELAELVALYQQLDDLANQVVGGGVLQTKRTLAPLRSYTFGAHEPELSSGTGVSVNCTIALQGTMQEAAETRYNKLHAKLEPMVTRLKQEGKLPDDAGMFLSTSTARSTLRTLNAKQQPTALLLLLPMLAADGSAMLAVSLHHEATLDRNWELPVPNDSLHALRTAWQFLLMDAEARAQGARCADGDGSSTASSWRGALKIDEPNSTLLLDRGLENATKSASIDILSAEDRHQLLHNVCLNAAKALMPALHALHDQGAQAVHVVPAGEWQAVPWAAELDQAIAGLAVRQFPTAAGWNNAIQAQLLSTTITRWASLAYDAAEHNRKGLLWVGAEQAALQRLWQPAVTGLAQTMVRVSPHHPIWPNPSPAGATASTSVNTGSEFAEADQVTGLVCIGHGDAPGGNLSLAGMLLPEKKHAQKDRKPHMSTEFFTAMHLHQIRHAHRLVMSCCVLGRIGDTHGEPLGMTALAFAFKTRFGVGAMLPIPDLEGALFSMALHYTWSRAERASTSSEQFGDWAGAFHSVRRQVMSGQWPVGFGEWLMGVWWPLLSELAANDADELGAHRPQTLFRLVGGTEGLAHWTKSPSQGVRDVAAVTVCLG